jgi:hypothetical protein
MLCITMNGSTAHLIDDRPTGLVFNNVTIAGADLNDAGFSRWLCPIVSGKTVAVGWLGRLLCVALALPVS